MKALFITTETIDCLNHVSAWNSFQIPAEHYQFKYRGIRNDWQILETAEGTKPGVIFYIGAHVGVALPKPATFRELRDMAPVIHLCSDAMDVPWHPMLEMYAAEKCFDLQVSIDGARYAPVDLATITPVNPVPFVRVVRDIRCGFSGTVGGPRGDIIRALGDSIRLRDRGGAYSTHGWFMSRCKMVLNVSFTGSGKLHHIKGRVLEAGWAGCCLLEDQDSPIGDWFPEGSYIKYRDAAHAKELIETLDDETIKRTAALLAKTVREKYTAEQIYGEMINAVGNTVT